MKLNSQISQILSEEKIFIYIGTAPAVSKPLNALRVYTKNVRPFKAKERQKKQKKSIRR